MSDVLVFLAGLLGALAVGIVGPVIYVERRPRGRHRHAAARRVRTGLSWPPTRTDP